MTKDLEEEHKLPYSGATKTRYMLRIVVGRDTKE